MAVLIDPSIDVAVRMESSRVIDHVIHVSSGWGRTEHWHRSVQLKMLHFFKKKFIEARSCYRINNFALFISSFLNIIQTIFSCSNFRKFTRNSRFPVSEKKTRNKSQLVFFSTWTKNRNHKLQQTNPNDHRLLVSLLQMLDGGLCRDRDDRRDGRVEVHCRVVGSSIRIGSIPSPHRAASILAPRTTLFEA